MNSRGETVNMGFATGQPSRGTAGLVLRRTWTVRRRNQHPRTPGRTTIFAVATSYSWDIRARSKSIY